MRVPEDISREVHPKLYSNRIQTRYIGFGIWAVLDRGFWIAVVRYIGLRVGVVWDIVSEIGLSDV